MCSCGKPTINGELGYRWQPTDAPSIHPLNPPDLRPGETLVYDEPGRCGGMDSHSFHYRVVSSIRRWQAWRRGCADQAAVLHWSGTGGT